MKLSRSVCRRVACALLSSPFIPAAVEAAFTNATSSTGIDYVHATSSNANGNHAGAAAVDVNGDGWTDFLGARAGLPPVLYMNQGNGTFVEQGASRGLAVAVDAGAFGAGDFDNDGDADLFIVPHGGARFFLMINDGTGNFSEEAVARGSALDVGPDKHFGYSVGLVDYDLDGYLDVYVSEWGVPASADKTLHSVLLRNRGSSAPGQFENVTGLAGLTRVKQYGFSSGWADFDGDGWPDLAVVADYGNSSMYWNDGDGTFTEGTLAAGVGKDENGMGVAVADYDGDGLLDFYVTSIYDRVNFNANGTHTGNKLYRNLGGRKFAEISAAAGVSRTGWGWGASFFEYDNDGDFDLVATNGSNLAAGADPNTTPYAEAAFDPTTVFANLGAGVYTNRTSTSGITDTGYGKAIVVFDYDNDGDEDLAIANSFGKPIVYRSDASANGNEWIRFRFVGTASNRDGIGALLRVTEGGKTQTLAYNPSNAYIGQREPYLHFGLGLAGGAADGVEVVWPSGIVQSVGPLASNQLHVLTEPNALPTPPAIAVGPLGGAFLKDRSMELSVEATGFPAPAYVWEKDGVTIEGANGPVYRIERIHPFDAGEYRVRAINPNGSATSAEAAVSVDIDLSSRSVARWWNEFLLDAIRKDFPAPTIHGRNLFHTSAAMWDAFWAYDRRGWGEAHPVFHQENPALPVSEDERQAAQSEAISHAAYRVLSERYKNSPGKERTLFGFRWLMERLGYDSGNANTTGSSAAAAGNRIGFGALAATLDDGSNEANGYADPTAYVAANEPMIFERAGAAMNDPNRWQPLAFDFLVTQNGIPIGAAVQKFIGSNWRDVRTFALAKPTASTFAIDPGPPPLLGTDTEAQFIDAAVEVIRYSSYLDPRDGVEIDISPGARLHNTLGTNDGGGRPVNPVTGQPYPANLVKRADYGRVLAEFWADGPSSETPPGHWNALHNEISDHPLFERRFAGAGPELSPLEWDVQAYLALNGAMHDAAAAAWGLKRQYDYVRPISMIRYLGGLGQSSDPGGPSYHSQGLPLSPGLIEVVTAESAAAGQRHAALAAHVGEIAIRAWAGEPSDAESQIGGVDWILAGNWLPYQRDTFVTPAFAAYVSGHSTFSRAGAEVMTLMTGSPFFPGGVGEFHFEGREYLEFEDGPSEDLTLQWATYYDAADQAGISRLYGGIHVRADDFVGRELGARVGLEAFLKTRGLRHGAVDSKGIVDLSSRGRAGLGDDVMISGFVIGGDQAQPVLMRAVGPGIGIHGVEGFVADPEMDMVGMSGAGSLGSVDDWSAGARAELVESFSRQFGAFALEAGSSDAADVQYLGPGVYATLTRCAPTDKRGVALSEIYGRNLLGISTRANVGQGEEVLIAGFVIEGPEASSVLVRGVGPALGEHGVTGFLADPMISVYRISPDGSISLVAANDDWSDDDRASLTEMAARVSGASALPRHGRDAALFLQLNSGTYAAIVTSKDESEGIALAEIYQIK